MEICGVSVREPRGGEVSSAVLKTLSTSCEQTRTKPHWDERTDAWPGNRILWLENSSSSADVKVTVVLRNELCLRVGNHSALRFKEMIGKTSVGFYRKTIIVLRMCHLISPSFEEIEKAGFFRWKKVAATAHTCSGCEGPLTWTLVKFSCLSDIPFAQSRALSDGWTDSIDIILWQHGIKIDAPTKVKSKWFSNHKSL